MPDRRRGESGPIRVPTHFVQKCTLRARLNASCSDKAIGGLPGDAGDPGDCAPGNAEFDDLADFVLPAVQARHASDPFGHPISTNKAAGLPVRAQPASTHQPDRAEKYRPLRRDRDRTRQIADRQPLTGPGSGGKRDRKALSRAVRRQSPARLGLKGLKTASTVPNPGSVIQTLPSRGSSCLCWVKVIDIAFKSAECAIGDAQETPARSARCPARSGGAGLTTGRGHHAPAPWSRDHPHGGTACASLVTGLP